MNLEDQFDVKCMILCGRLLYQYQREKFGVVHDGGEEMNEYKARCISIHKTDRELESFTGMSKIRSFYLFLTTH
jgi:hypothetical protein